MPNLLKIGCTDRSSTERINELSCATGVPTPFHLEFEVRFIDHLEGEAAIHKELEPFRLSGSREFFRVPIESARRTVRTHWENQVLSQLSDMDADSKVNFCQTLLSGCRLDADLIAKFCRNLVSGRRDAYETLVRTLVVGPGSYPMQFSNLDGDLVVRYCQTLLSGHQDAFETLAHTLFVGPDSPIPSENHMARKFSGWRTDSIVKLCLKILAWHPTARGELKSQLMKDLSV